jgi:IS30 family transposase
MAKNNSKKHVVMDNIDKIKEWLSNGVTMSSIAKTLHVSKQTLYTHLKDIEGLDTIKNSRAPAVEHLENTMFTSATGYTRKVKKYAKVKRIEYVDGKKSLEYEEMVEYEEEIYYAPDTTAGIFLLKNWGNYVNEPKMLEIRKQELELKKANSWIDTKD